MPGHDYTREPFDSAPHLTRTQLGRVVGLDVDVIRALEAQLGTRFELVQTRWIDLESGLLAGRYDMILDAWTPSASTPAGIVATDPYYTWGLLMAARSQDASIREPKDLTGKRLGPVSDPSVLRALEAMGESLGTNRVVVDQGGDEMFRRLARGELDVVLFDSPFVRWRVARDPAFRVVGEPLTQLGYCVGVRAEDKALFERMQAAVHAFVASPEAKRIRHKWETAEAPAR